MHSWHTCECPAQDLLAPQVCAPVFLQCQQLDWGLRTLLTTARTVIIDPLDSTGGLPPAGLDQVTAPKASARTTGGCCRQFMHADADSVSDAYMIVCLGTLPIDAYHGVQPACLQTAVGTVLDISDCIPGMQTPIVCRGKPPPPVLKVKPCMTYPMCSWHAGPSCTMWPHRPWSSHSHADLPLHKAAALACLQKNVATVTDSCPVQLFSRSVARVASLPSR